MEQTGDIQQNAPRKGLNLDLSDAFVGEDMLVHARNACLFNHNGEFLSIQNEQSPLKLLDLPYQPIGVTKLPDGTWCLFMTDDTSSEIGIFSELSRTYTKKLNAPWLNLNRSFLISAVSKENYDGSFSVYWADGRRNPDRILNLSQTAAATYDSIRLAKLITPPILSLKKGTAGILPNGSYQMALRYSVNNKAFGDVYSTTLPVSVFHEGQLSGSLDVSISNTDNDFTQYQLIVIQEAQGTSTAKSIGYFPSKTSNVHISSFDRAEYLNVPLSDLVIQNTPIVASDKMESNNQLLFRIGTESVPEVDYQLQALDIRMEYVVEQALADYYEQGDKVGYYRDEVYAPSIQLLHKTGTWSSAFVLAGREATPNDLGLASGSDVYERLVDTCEDRPIPKWMVENTASPLILTGTDEATICETRFLGYGEMAYYESTDLYPDNKIQFGKWANTPIRLPKMPDEEKCPRYSVIKGKSYINILGWRFINIPHPLKADGTPDLDWVGYRIIRADRNGNKSVISRGLLTNVRSYTEKQGSEDVNVMFTNYPVNDLRPDSFLSKAQTYYKANKEQGYKPLTDFYLDRYSFYSPHSVIGRYAFGSEMKIESEEVAQVDGGFTPVYRHPKQRLLSLFSFWLAAATGATEALLITLGKNNYYSETDTELGIPPKLTHKMGKSYNVSSVEDLIGLDIISFTKDNILAGRLDVVSVVKNILLVLTAVGLKALTFTFYGIQTADQIINVITNFLGYTDYTLQYNCHAFFNKSLPVKRGYKRRYVSKYQYLENGLQTISDSLYNNFGKHNAVYIELNQPLSPFKTVDNSRQTMKEFNLGDDITKKTRSTGVAYYATSKVPHWNQYGRVESTTNFLLTHNNFFPATPKDRHTTYSTGNVFGGDCYINRFTYQTKHQFFTQNLANTNAPNGEEFDYKLYRNIAYPRFWANFFRYDFSELIDRDVATFSSFSNTVTSRHNLDNKGKDDVNKFRVDNAYFYLSNNGVLDFFVESDYNLSYREKPISDAYVYSSKFSTLPEIFRSDRLNIPEEFRYDTSLNKQATQVYAQQQPANYDPGVYASQYKYVRNRLAYSLPAFQEQQYDSWQYFLTANQYTFPTSDFGNLVSLHRVDGDRILFLFDRSSPYITTGQDELQLRDGTSIQIGDGGIFARPPKELMYTEQHYGSSQSRNAAISTQYGSFYVSERQGRLLNYAGNLDDVTRNGLQMWSKQYFPVKLTSFFPGFKDTDNPIVGVGYNISVDAIWDVIYISKRDFQPRDIQNTTYENNAFYYKGVPITLGDPSYFDDLSFTLSYSPTLKAFISFHDWVPDLVIPAENHFITSKGNSLYLHNSNPFSYNVYYGKSFPFEVGWIVSNKFRVETLSSLEYYLEAYRYIDKKNKVHLLYDNFDKAIISNTEQVSGLLTLLHETNNPYEDYLYPKPNLNGYDILFSKVENKYRINDFWDITKDRQANIHLIHVKPNGYERIINPEAIDPNKNAYERKAFRHYNTSVMLMKEQSNDVNLILHLSKAKEVRK